MSNELTTFNFDAKLPDLPADIVSAGNEMLADLSGGLQGRAFNRIAVRNGRFLMLVGGEVVKVIDSPHIDVVIVGSANKVQRQFYLKAYDADAPKERPTCWSSDGVTPAADVPIEQRQGNACSTCPKNAKGSAADGKSRACAFRKPIVIVPGGGEEVQGIASETPMPWLMVVNAQSMYDDSMPDKGLYSLKGYTELLSRPRPGAPKGYPPGYMRTRVSVDMLSQTPKYWFGPLGFLNAAEIRRSVDLFRSEEVKAMLDRSADEVALAQGDRAPGVPERQTPALEQSKAPAPVPTSTPVPAAAPDPVSTTEQEGPDGEAGPIHWIDYATENGVETDDIDLVYLAGGPGTANGLKLWNKLIGLELDDLVDLGLTGSTTYNPAPAPAPAPEAKPSRRGRPKMSDAEKAAKAAERQAAKAAEQRQSLPEMPPSPPPAQAPAPVASASGTVNVSLAERIKSFDL